MKTRFNGFAVTTALALGWLILGPTPAYAVYELMLTDVGAGVSVRCANFGAADSAGCVSLGAGSEVFAGTVGTFSVNVTTGITKPITTLPTAMDINTVNVSSLLGGTLMITWSDTDWSFDVPPFLFQMVAGGTIAPGGTIKYEAFADDSNTVSGTPVAGLINTLGPFGPGAFSRTATGAPLVTNPYSLTQRLTLTFTGSGISSGDFELQVVPEPSSVALLGGVLLLTAGAIRRRAMKP